MECNNQSLIDELQKFYNDQLEDNIQCTVNNCKTSWSHITTVHHFSNINHISTLVASAVLIVPTVEKVSIECPMCSKTQQIEKTPNKLFGLTEKCKVCYTNEVELALGCGHACLCLECFQIMTKQKDIADFVDKNDSDSED
jgi:DNA replicative helicase MCM subunit Mcm2 (Cdc46/Mcm family)